MNKITSKLKRLLGKRNFSKYYEKLSVNHLSDFEKEIIRESQTFNRVENNEDSPLVIDRKHLMNKKYWKNWAFSIIILIKNKLLIQKYKEKFTLSIILQGENLGIYN